MDEYRSEAEELRELASSLRAQGRFFYASELEEAADRIAVLEEKAWMYDDLCD